MNNPFSPGDIIAASRPSMVGESWAKPTFLVIDAKHLNHDGQFTEPPERQASPYIADWLLTVMKLDGSSEVMTTYFDSAAWSKINT